MMAGFLEWTSQKTLISSGLGGDFLIMTTFNLDLFHL